MRITLAILVGIVLALPSRTTRAGSCEPTIALVDASGGKIDQKVFADITRTMRELCTKDLTGYRQSELHCVESVVLSPDVKSRRVLHELAINIGAVQKRASEAQKGLEDAQLGVHMKAHPNDDDLYLPAIDGVLIVDQRKLGRHKREYIFRAVDLHNAEPLGVAKYRSLQGLAGRVGAHAVRALAPTLRGAGCDI